MAAATDYGLACVIAGQMAAATDVFKQCAHKKTTSPAAPVEADDDDAVVVLAADNMAVDEDAGGDGGSGGKEQGGEDAVTIFTGILEASLKAYGDNSVRSLSTAGNLGIMLMHAEMHDEAAALFEWTTSSMKRVLGNEHPHTLRAAVNWGKSTLLCCAHH